MDSNYQMIALTKVLVKVNPVMDPLEVKIQTHTVRF